MSSTTVHSCPLGSRAQARDGIRVIRVAIRVSWQVQLSVAAWGPEPGVRQSRNSPKNLFFSLQCGELRPASLAVPFRGIVHRAALLALERLHLLARDVLEEGRHLRGLAGHVRGRGLGRKT